ncbi:heavy metal translocating P-type ATPase [Paenibacillus sp. GCM10023252]|uniref:heavy metal translocating P-type ATPase n=1 Tax=Paenibacillus sp. GCM10023252 TaxID=3252649 RepID=UPI0036127CE7
MNTDSTVQVIDLQLQGMSCTACAARIEKSLRRMEGVEAVSVSFPARTAWVQYQPAIVEQSQMISQIGKLGFHAAVPESGRSSLQQELKSLRLRLWLSILLTLPLLASMTHHYEWLSAIPVPQLLLQPWLQLALATVVQFAVGMPFYFGAYHALRQRAANMDVLVVIGTTAAYLYSHYMVVTGGLGTDRGGHELPLYFETSAVVITAVLLGKYLEGAASSRAQQEVDGYHKLLNHMVTVERAGQHEQIRAAFVREGDIVIVEAGETIAVDGIVLSGSADVLEALLTGESLPVLRKNPNRVLAGTEAISGSLRIRTIAAGEGTLISRISELVKQAQASKSELGRQVDRVAGWFVPAMLVCAALTFVLWWALLDPGNTAHAFVCAIAVMLAACPCAMGLAAPISLVIASGKLAKRGIIVKDAGALERLSRMDTLVVDKTGTLTEGKPVVSGIYTEMPGGRQALLRLAAAAELQLQHPLAKAIAAAAADAGLVPPTAEHTQTIPGKGVAARIGGKRIGIGNARLAAEQGWTVGGGIHAFAQSRESAGQTVLFVAEEGRCMGSIALTDRVKLSSIQAVKQLRRDGITVMLATGDHPAPALAAAKAAGIGQLHASMLPEGKLALIQQLKAEGRRVGMAGDGWNDAPALAAADIGLAMGDGTDAALSAGHLTLVKSRLTAIPEALQISRLTLRNIRSNLMFALLYNIMIIPFAAAGLLEPWMAGTAMALSSVSVVGNALRLSGQIDRMDRRWLT